MDKMIEWSNEFTFEFLEMYKDEHAIWNLSHPDHKRKDKVVDAWVRLSERSGKPIPELKRKKDSLMATFRMHWRKKKASIQSGAKGNNIYKPIWFAFEYMDSFLGPLYKGDFAGDSEETLFSEETTDDSTAALSKPCTVQITNFMEDMLSATATATSSPAPQKRRRKRYETENHVERVCPTTDASENCDAQDGDECGLYGKILAKRLRRLPVFDRQLLMHDIDGMVLEVMQRNRQSHQDAPASHSSWNSNEPQSAYPSPYSADEN